MTLNEGNGNLELKSTQNSKCRKSIDETLPQFVKPAEAAGIPGWRRYIGIIFAFCAAFCFGFSTLSTKIVAGRYHPMNVCFWRYVIIGLGILCFILYYQIIKRKNVFKGLMEDNGKTLAFLVLRGTIGFISFATFTYSLRYMNLADATVITFSTPIAVVFFARLFLKEPCGIVPIIAAVISLTGVVVLTRPPLLTGGDDFDTETLLGTALAFASMLCLTSVYVVIRYLRKLHFTIPILASGIVSTTEALICCLFLGVLEFPRTQEDFWVTLGGGVVMVFGQLFMVLSLKFEEAGPVSLVRSSDIVFGFVLQYIFLNTSPDIYSVVGAAIVILGIIFSTARKWLSTLPEKHETRMKFAFMLK